jgi:hypothetical protein
VPHPARWDAATRPCPRATAPVRQVGCVRASGSKGSRSCAPACPPAGRAGAPSRASVPVATSATSMGRAGASRREPSRRFRYLSGRTMVPVMRPSCAAKPLASGSR